MARQRHRAGRPLAVQLKGRPGGGLACGNVAGTRVPGGWIPPGPSFVAGPWARKRIEPRGQLAQAPPTPRMRGRDLLIHRISLIAGQRQCVRGRTAAGAEKEASDREGGGAATRRAGVEPPHRHAPPM
jgi:hypothetical protein